MTSIRDVAKLAGVSPSTVSRVINGTAKVDEEKMQRVLNANLMKRVSNLMKLLVPCLRNHQGSSA